MNLDHKMPCSVSAGPHENPNENWYDAQDVLEEITRSQNLEVLFNEETQQWEKQ